MGFVKSQEYGIKLYTFQELKIEIICVIEGIWRDVCERVVKNFEEFINDINWVKVDILWPTLCFILEGETLPIEIWNFSNKFIFEKIKF